MYKEEAIGKAMYLKSLNTKYSNTFYHGMNSNLNLQGTTRELTLSVSCCLLQFKNMYLPNANNQNHVY